jgi:hypothetical protein
MEVGILEFVVAAAAVLVGSVVQGAVGFGLNLLAAPFIAIVIPEALPFALVLLALPVTVTTFTREHHARHRSALPWMLAGAVPGTLIGLLILGAVDATGLAILVGAVTVVGVFLSVVTPPVPINRGTALGAGFLSNISGTAAAVGGPPVALLFQHARGSVARATLGAFFMVSASLSIAGYFLTGNTTVDQLVLAVALAPFMIAGLWASRHLHGLVDGGWLRPAVLAISAVAGLTAIIRGLS